MDDGDLERMMGDLEWMMGIWNGWGFRIDDGDL